MAELFGILAGVAGFASLSVQIGEGITKLRTIRDSAGQAATDISTLIRELDLLTYVMQDVDAQTSLRNDSVIQHCRADCDQVVRDLKSLLTKLPPTSRSTTKTNVLKLLAFRDWKENVESLQRSIQGAKVNLILITTYRNSNQLKELALVKNHEESVTLLIESGANINVRDTRYGRDFLDYAAIRKHWKLIYNFLVQLETLAEKSIVESWAKKAVILYHIDYPDHFGEREISLHQLLMKCSSANFTFDKVKQGTRDNCLLHFATRVTDFEALLSSGFKLFHQRNSDGQTPLMVAAKSFKPDLVKRLLDNGADSVIPEQKCTRELLGAWVNFGSGASVEKVSLFSDFSTASILDLPARTDIAAVCLLLNRLGFDVPSTGIRMRPPGLGGLVCASIRVEDPEFAQSLSDKFKDSKVEELSGMPGLKVEVHKPPNLDSNNKGFTHRVNCKKVICSWHKAKQIACLTFGSDSAENLVRSNFGTGKYTVLGSKVSCAPRSSTLLHQRGSRLGGRYLPASLPKLRLYIPTQATTADIISMIPQGQRPKGVKLEGLQDLDNTKSEFDMVEALLVNIGPLETRLTAKADQDGNRVEARARFQNEADAITAARSLNLKTLPFNKDDRLSISLVHCATYKVTCKIFSTVLVNFETTAQIFRAQRVNFKQFPPANGYVTLRLESGRRDFLSEALISMDKILEGRLVYAAEGKKPLWSPSFNNKALANRRLRPIEEQHRVAFQCFPSKAEIHVFGSLEATQKACDALLQSFSENPSTVRSIFLTSESLHWAIRGGLKAICEALGPEAASLNILETPKRLEIIGPPAAFDTAMDILDKRRLPREHDSSAATEDDCPTSVARFAKNPQLSRVLEENLPIMPCRSLW
ncbi:hypothetical protein CORC01_08693 [Colletotrichum orchidophilum]|uniref:Uncharacterized protein n=1 Tax=Colletotrichum orchidophilum TaxID=1209926 RepID=A0A1G4B3K6_9PEZI|nr:uncharacterized protein CORC01_08693 [Colletotrichum orchidophilum]OHE96000.1 hypothetical protein CORC01_08693 [Colletotrichum orchidophilum]